MIKNTDFRIGNLVMDEVSGEWMRVDALSKAGITCELINGNKYPLSNGWRMASIPLTPEILEKVGLVALRYLTFDTKDSFEHFGIWKNGGLYTFGNILRRANEGGVSVFQMEIKFLHQLQNLLYTLLGEELQIDLKDFVTIK